MEEGVSQQFVNSEARSFLGDIIVGCSPLLAGTVPLLHCISTIRHFLVHKVNFKSPRLLAPRPFMAFEIDSQRVETEVEEAWKKSNFFITCLSNWGQEKILVVKGKTPLFALQNNWLKLC